MSGNWLKHTSNMRIAAFVGLLGLSATSAHAQLASPNVEISELNGQTVYEGTWDYDQIDYDGVLGDYVFERNADNSVSVTKPDGITDLLINIDGLWFFGEEKWYSIFDVAVPTTKNQTITGSPDDYDQVNYEGFASDYTFTLNSDLSVSVDKPNGGVDTLIDIDGIWFTVEEKWYAINNLITVPASGETYTGTNYYDQVDYPGASTDYVFIRNEDNSVTVNKPDGGIDTLILIDGIWFQGEAAWYSMDILAPIEGISRVFTGTEGYDQVDYDGERTDYHFIQNDDDTVTVIRPDGGTDTLIAIDGFWFVGEEEWYSLEMVLDSEPTGQNNPPELVMPNQDQTAIVNTQFIYDASRGGQAFTDPDGDALTYTVLFDPDDGTFTADQQGVITGTPAALNVWTASIFASDGTDTSPVNTFSITSLAGQTAVQAQFGGNIDLGALLDYETRNVPDYVRAPNEVRNPVTNAGATLGRVLFYDRALSIDDTVSCASCHQQANAFGDLAVISNGVEGGVTGRHSMRLINTQWSDETAFFWDERAVDVEAQVTAPMRDHNEHGFSGQNGRPDFDDMIVKMEGLDYYPELFEFVFGTPEITEDRIQSALGQFVNSIVSFDSRYDEGIAAEIANTPGADPSDPFDPVWFQDFDNFTFDENEGKALYMMDPPDGGAGCRRCHADPTFAVFQESGHIGVIGVAGDPDAVDMTNTKSPSLRDVFKGNGETNGPFMHDGSMATMREVLDHYDDIPVPEQEPLRTEFLDTIDPQLIEFGIPVQLVLTDIEKAQIEAFLRTLTGSNVYTDEKWSDPFP